MVAYKIKEILDLIKCPVICIVNREEREYVTGEKAYADMLKKDVVQGKNLEYRILGITTEEDKVVISLEKNLSDSVSADMNAAWIRNIERNTELNQTFLMECNLQVVPLNGGTRIDIQNI